MPKQECGRARGKCRTHSRGGRDTRGGCDEFFGLTSVRGRVSACLRICCAQGTERLSATQLLPHRPQLLEVKLTLLFVMPPFTSSVLSPQAPQPLPGPWMSGA